MDGAEVYLLMIRKSMLPILGEAVAMPFTQQVEILNWDWTLVNQEQMKKHQKDDQKDELLSKTGKKLKADLDVMIEELKESLSTAQDKGTKELLDIAQDPKLTDRQKTQKIAEVQEAQTAVAAAKGTERGAKLVQKTIDDRQKQQEENSLKFKFSKRLDFASTQMLNVMKAGEIMPRAVLTVFHRSVNTPLVLTLTMKNIVLLNYSLSVEVDDTMADMKEEWEAQFSEVAFLYGNRRVAGGPKTVAEAITTGQPRAFTMKSRD